MNKLIEIIKPYFSHFMGDTPELIAKEIADKLVSSGLMKKEFPYQEIIDSKVYFNSIQDSILSHPNKSQFSDGYHTFEDLYSIRLAYNVALFNEWGKQRGIGYENSNNSKHDVHKSQRHHDGELCFGGGWFIVVANLSSGQISNHYEMKHWDLFRIPETEKAKYEWDGHTSEDVINRLKSL